MADVHRQQIERYPDTLDALAGEVGDLRYDALAAFLRALADKLAADAMADEGRGRPKLAAALRCSAAGVGAAASAVERAWVISSPHMDLPPAQRGSPDRDPIHRQSN